MVRSAWGSDCAYQLLSVEWNLLPKTSIDQGIIIIIIKTKNYQKEKKSRIVREVAQGEKHHLRKSADRKTQISSVSETYV